MPTEQGRASWPAWIALVAYAAVLVLLSDTAPAAGERGAATLTPLGLLRDVASAGALAFARFLPIGFLAALALPRRMGRLDRLLLVFLPAVALGFALTVGVTGFETESPWSLPRVFDLALPLAGCLLGSWMGMAWTRGWSGRVWMLPKLAFLLALVAGAGAALLYLAAEQAPLDFEPTRVTSAERRRLYRLFKDANPSELPEGKTAELRLTARDLDLLLAWGLSLSGNERKARVALDPDAATLEASLRVPGGRRAPYLNLTASADVRVEDGAPSVHVHRLSAGRLKLPAWLLDLVTPLAVRAAASDRRVKPLLEPIHSLETEAGSLRVRYGRAEPPRGFLADLFRGEGAGEADIPKVQAHLEHLIRAAKDLPKGDARFTACLRTAFSHARERSRDGDAVGENRAAILALGMLLGHWRVETLVGRVTDGGTMQKAVRAFRGTTLRGRDDWPKHFFVSAALTALAIGSLSDAAGLLKEEIDADGGSGFSFGDLLADRAGTTFATTATRDEPTARTFQERLARGVTVDDVFPSAAGLPEGIQDAELRARYGGVGGEGYRKLAAEVEKRLERCGAYRL
jgi:hypothetical protein